MAARNLIDVKNVLDAPESQTGMQLSDMELGAAREYSSLLSELIACLHSYSLQWDQHIDHLHASDANISYSAPVSSRGRGRPRFTISRDQLVYLSSLNFTWTDISAMLGVSRMTIYRRRQEFGLVDVREQITDTNLHSLLRDIRIHHPHMGEVMVLGQVRGMGFAVSRARIRQGIRETDPLNVASRGLLGSTARRPYSVPSPNSLWHIGMLYHLAMTYISASYI